MTKSFTDYHCMKFVLFGKHWYTPAVDGLSARGVFY